VLNVLKTNPSDAGRTSHARWFKYFSIFASSSQHLGYFAIKFARDLFYYISVSADERDGDRRGRASTYALFSCWYCPRFVHSLHRAYRAYQPALTTMTTTYIPQHVRIFVFGWDHVWIKWQHGSPADADIRPLRSACTNTRASVKQLGTWIHPVIHTNICGYTCPCAFLHHHTVTYAAEIAEM